MTWAGTFVSGDLTLELRPAPQGGEVHGEIVLGGERMPLRAVAAGPGLQGVFAAGGAEFSFRARLEGDTLRVESDGVEHVLTRQGPPPRPNPLAALKKTAPPAAPAPPAPAPSADAAAEAGQLYRHPTGGQFRVPAGWTAQPAQGGIQLVPPGAGFGPTGPTEVYLVTGEPAPGITAAGDPRVVAYLDHSLAQLIPGASRAGGVEPLGHGVRLRYQARNAMTGSEIHILSLVSIVKGNAIAITGIADPPTLERRRPALEGVQASLDWGEGDRDPALAGVWHHWSYTSSGGGSGSTSSHSAETRRVIQLHPDGRAFLRSSTETSANLQGRDGGGDTTWTASTFGQGGDEKTGTWSAAGGMLYLIWSDGATAAWPYRVTGAPGARRVTLTQAGAAKPIEWTEKPV